MNRQPTYLSVLRDAYATLQKLLFITFSIYLFCQRLRLGEIGTETQGSFLDIAKSRTAGPDLSRGPHISPDHSRICT